MIRETDHEVHNIPNKIEIDHLVLDKDQECVTVKETRRNFQNVTRIQNIDN